VKIDCKPLESLIKYSFPLCSIKYILNEIEQSNPFAEKLINSVQEYPAIDLNDMGFTNNWQNDRAWK